MRSAPRPVLLVDRDGTIIAEPHDHQIDAYDKLEFVPGAIPALMHLTASGYDLVLVSNQDGLGSSSFPQETFDGPHRLMMQVLESCSVGFREVLIDRTLPEERAATRKPGTGMLTELLKDRSIDWERSAVVGDRTTDLELAQNLGITGYQLGPIGDWDWGAIVHDLVDQPRTAEVARTTTETQVDVFVDLDAARGRLGLPGDGSLAVVDPLLADDEGPLISTGIGFLDHMLEQLAKHSGIQIELRAVGDLHIDTHHTVEDTALSLGEAISKALGRKHGIGRYGFTTAMDDSLATAAIDLSGRPWFTMSAQFPAEMVGDLPTEMVTHFWRSFADAARMTLHLEIAGENAHHMVEASFKAVGRALGQAVARTGGSDVPSTKGVL